MQQQGKLTPFIIHTGMHKILEQECTVNGRLCAIRRKHEKRSFNAAIKIINRRKL